jgi:2-amino-4-hydroxy-6-hydroxymethyldihydropteridine diphosphokinase
MIVVALGANLPGPAGDARAQLERALALMPEHGIKVIKRSRWYRSPAWPPSDQPDYVNGVAIVRTALGPARLLKALHAIEAALGRARGAANEARSIDLDLIDFNGRVRRAPDPVLPHPRAHLRGFVLAPLAEVAPGWRHPATGTRVKALLAAAPANTRATADDALG